MSGPSMTSKRSYLVVLLVSIFLVSACDDSTGPVDPGITDPDIGLDAALTILLNRHGGAAAFMLPSSDDYDNIPQDPNNPVTPEKVALGQFLFHETALAVSNVRPEGRETYSCSSCHVVGGRFMSNLPQGIAEGGIGFGIAGEGRTLQPQYDSDPDTPDIQAIRVPTFMHGGYQQVLLWNGQFGGVGINLGTEDKWEVGTPLESNYLGLQGMETQAHGGLLFHRMVDVENSRINEIPEYEDLFAAAYPVEAEPINRLNVALAIAAYERIVLANRAPFQVYVRGDDDAITTEQKRGAILYFGKANCVACHTGPALSSMSFHALGMNDLDGAYDQSRVDLRPFDGTVPDDARLGRGGFTGQAEDNYKFKTPQLYNLDNGPFYGHGASFAAIREVVEYKNAAIPQNSLVPAEQLAPEFRPLGLTESEIDDLVEFLEHGLYDPDLERYLPDRIPSGNCFPVNDPQARIDLGCGPSSPSLLAGR